MGIRQELHDGATLTWKDLKRTKQELAEGVQAGEILFVFGILPGLLLAVEIAILSEYWIFAEVTRSRFWLEIRGQQLFSWETLIETYLSSIAHSGWDIHLKPNLTNYLICMTAFYPMAILSRRKDRVVKLFLFILLIAPLITTVFSFLYPMGARTIGFSGVLTAIFGFLPVLIFAGIDARLEQDFNPFWSVMVIFIVYASIFVYLGNLIMAAIAAAISLIFLAGLTFRVGVEGLLDAASIVLGIAYLPFLWALIISYVGAVGMYYNLPPGTNVVAHIAGYKFGFLVGFLGLSDLDSISEMAKDWM